MHMTGEDHCDAELETLMVERFEIVKSRHESCLEKPNLYLYINKVAFVNYFLAHELGPDLDMASNSLRTIIQENDLCQTCPISLI